MALPNVTPMELVRQKTPFDHPDWLFEIKYDGFRSLAYVDDGCKLVSRNESTTNASRTWLHHWLTTWPFPTSSSMVRSSAWTIKAIPSSTT